MPLYFSDGLWWPVGDKECRKPALADVGNLDRALKYVDRKDTCVQAGGNCGVWPAYLAGKFGEVWTIEADFTNYRCLVRNCAGLGSIRPVWAALSSVSGKGVALKRDVRNIGAHHIDSGNSKMEVATLAIDDLELDSCGFIQLDIEGMEPRALEGARQTVERFKPVIMVEDNGTSTRYGVPAGWEQTFPGYRVVDSVRRDVILVPC